MARVKPNISCYQRIEEKETGAFALAPEGGKRKEIGKKGISWSGQKGM